MTKSQYNVVLRFRKYAACQPTRSTTKQMQQSGKLLIVGILGVALAAAGFAWWFQFSRGQRALAYWGGETASIIRHGDAAELFLIATSGNGESLEVDGQNYVMLREISLDAAPGFVHARHALIDDASYRWDDPPPDAIVWTHAVAFDNQQGQVVWTVISLDDGVLRQLEGSRPLVMSEKLQAGLKQFFAEQLAEEPRDE